MHNNPQMAQRTKQAWLTMRAKWRSACSSGRWCLSSVLSRLRLPFKCVRGCSSMRSMLDFGGSGHRCSQIDQPHPFCTLFFLTMHSASAAVNVMHIVGASIQDKGTLICASHELLFCRAHEFADYPKCCRCRCHKILQHGGSMLGTQPCRSAASSAGAKRGCNALNCDACDGKNTRLKTRL